MNHEHDAALARPAAARLNYLALPPQSDNGTS